MAGRKGSQFRRRLGFQALERRNLLAAGGLDDDGLPPCELWDPPYPLPEDYIEKCLGGEWPPDGPGNDGPGNDGPDNDGSDDDGPDNDGPDNDGPNDDGPDNDGPGNDKPDNDGPDTDGPDDDGPDDDGPDDDGPDDDGPDNDGPDDDGPDDDGPDDDGPDTDGPDTDGPDNDGPDNDGPDDDGPDNDGPDTDGPDNDGSDNDGSDDRDDPDRPDCESPVGIHEVQVLGDHFEEVSEVREGETFTVFAFLNLGCGEDLPPARISVDENMNTVYENEEVHLFEMDGPFVHSVLMVSVTPIDDGPYPGNDQPSDPLKFEVVFGTDRVESSVEVFNVVPAFPTEPVVSSGTDEELGPFVEISAVWRDASWTEEFTLSAEWGDGETTAVSIEPDAADFTFSGTVRRYYSADEPISPLFPIEVAIADDDVGSSSALLTEDLLDRNDDDDNENDESDLYDFGTHADPDLIALDLGQFKNDLMDARTGYFKLVQSGQSVRVWDSPSKDALILGNEGDGPDDDGSSSGGGESNPFFGSGHDIIPYDGRDLVFLEGFVLGVSQLSLHWEWSFAKAASMGIERMVAPFHTVVFGGAVTATTVGIDYDIDSDNDDLNRAPDRSAWEDYIEDHNYGIGKILCLRNPEKPADPCRNSRYAPSILQIAPGIKPVLSNIRVKFEERSPSSSGQVRLSIKHPEQLPAVPSSIEAGGSVVTPGREYTLDELKVNRRNGTIIVWINALTANRSTNTKDGVRGGGKPIDRIIATVSETNGPRKWQDAIRRINVYADTFFENLNRRDQTGTADRGTNGEAIRNLLTSDLVYSLRGNKDWSIKKVDTPELLDLGFSQEFADAIYDHGVEGLKVAFYQDFVARKYIIAFAGTEFEFADIMTDLVNASGRLTDQYAQALRIGNLLLSDLQTRKELDWASSSIFRITGHSLGGGLASAAYTTSGVRADTFNAAGMPEAILYHWSGDLIPEEPKTELYPDSVARYQAAGHFVEAYFMEDDILSFLQDNRYWIADYIVSLPLVGPGLKLAANILLHPAIGRRIQLDGPFERQVNRTIDLSWLANPPIEMIKSHKMSVLNYGLFVEEIDDEKEWDILGTSDF